MTTYILKDSYEQLIKRETTQQILLIMKELEDKKFTKRQLFEIGTMIFRKRFTSDPNKVIRYLKTMAKYGLVYEEKQGKGKTSLWRLSKLSPYLIHQLIINSHIRKINAFSQDPSLGITHSLYSNPDDKNNPVVTVYGLFGLPILKELEKTKHGKELDDIKKQFFEPLFKLVKLRSEIFNKLFDIKSDETRNSCESYIDQIIVIIYKLSLKYHYFEDFYFDGQSIYFFGFEKEKFPYVLKSSLSLVKLVHMFSKYYDNQCDKEEIWKKLNGYQLNEKLSKNLSSLHDIFYEYFMGLTRLTVVCDLGLPRGILSQIKLKQREKVNYIDSIPADQELFEKAYQDMKKPLDEKN